MIVRVIGAGLAGCEAAYRLANHGIDVELYEMKPIKMSAAHHSTNFSELVCSNSLKASRLESSAGLLKEEMRRFNSLVMQASVVSEVPAGGALAVDREIFSDFITNKIKTMPNIKIINEVIESIDAHSDIITIVATGPLTDSALAENISVLCGGMLNFYDAAAPIVSADSIDMNYAFCASRYDRGGDDYINCPMNKEQYDAFYEELISAERIELKSFEKDKKLYEGCMPIELMAERGHDTIRFGPMKPVGLVDPNTGHRPWANLQLRRENAAGTMYNLVGFQTNLKFGEQKRVFSMIPALHNAEFLRYGVMHRNTFIDSPRVLNKDLSLKSAPNIFFAGQITGVEGYTESAMCGIMAAENVIRRINGISPICLPDFTMTGALINYITDDSVTNFQPMGANFGVLPPLNEHIRDKKERYAKLSARSVEWFDDNIKEVQL